MFGFILRRIASITLKGAKIYSSRNPDHERRVAFAAALALAFAMRAFDRWPGEGERMAAVLQDIQDHVTMLGAELYANLFAELKASTRTDKATDYGIAIVANWFKLISELQHTRKAANAALLWEHREFISRIIDDHDIRISDEKLTDIQLGLSRL